MIELTSLTDSLHFLSARIDESRQLALVVLTDNFEILDCSKGFADLIEYSGPLRGVSLKALLLAESRERLGKEPGDNTPLQLHFVLSAANFITLSCTFQQIPKGYLLYAEQARMADSDVMRTMSLLNNEMAGLTRELNRKNRTLQELQTKLQAKNEEIEKFASIVAHDFTSPLITISSFLGKLKSDIAAGSTDRIDTDISYITTAVTRLTQLLDALHQVTRVGSANNPPRSVGFTELVNTCLKTLAGPLQQHGVEVVVREDPVTLTGDQLHFGQIWQNLIENAVKYRGDQPAPRLVIGVDGDRKPPEFYVCDNGMGVEPKQARRIFDLFTQLNPDSDGRGLGLALIKRLVELYQGTIYVESEGTGKGSCFRFTLPAATP